MVLEGVHLVPGMLPRESRARSSSTCVVAIEDEERARRALLDPRRASEGVRPLEKYLDAARRHPPPPGLHRRARRGRGRAGGRERANIEQAIGGVHGARARARPSGYAVRRDRRRRREPSSAPRARRRAAPCLCESYARVTERAALAGARWLGRADQDGGRGGGRRRAMRDGARAAADRRAAS